MNKVFAVTCHQITNPLIFTVNYLSSFDENIILIHVDKKSDIKDFYFLQKENVILINDRVSVHWGAYSQIQATLNLLVKSQEYQYEYFFLMSGDDILLKSNADLNIFLNKNYGKNFIHYQDERNNFVDPLNRVKFIYPNFFYKREKTILAKIKYKFFSLTKNIFFVNKKFYLYKNKMPILFKGGNWFGLTKDSIDYILQWVYINKWYDEVFIHSLCADGVYFHTILATRKEGMNKFYDPTYMNDALRYIDWEKGPEYPRVLDSTDVLAMKSSNMFFAKKIHKNENTEFMKQFIGVLE